MLVWRSPLAARSCSCTPSPFRCAHRRCLECLIPSLAHLCKQKGFPRATRQLGSGVRGHLGEAVSPRPQEDEYNYDDDDAAAWYAAAAGIAGATATTRESRGRPSPQGCKIPRLCRTVEPSFLREDQDSSKGGAVETGCSGLYYIIYYMCLLHNTTPIHCTPLRLHPPLMNTQKIP